MNGLGSLLVWSSVPITALAAVSLLPARGVASWAHGRRVGDDRLAAGDRGRDAAGDLRPAAGPVMADAESGGWSGCDHGRLAGNRVSGRAGRRRPAKGARPPEWKQAKKGVYPGAGGLGCVPARPGK